VKCPKNGRYLVTGQRKLLLHTERKTNHIFQERNPAILWLLVIPTATRVIKCDFDIRRIVGCLVVVTNSKPSCADDTSYLSACLATDIGLVRTSKQQFPTAECHSTRIKKMRTAPRRAFLKRASKSHFPAHLHDCSG
jgi:hypothetical protein